MRKAKSLLGLSVITRADGKNLGSTRDLIFSENSQKLIALLLSDRELFGMIDAKCVPWNVVREVGTDAIMVEGDEAVQNVHTDAIIAEAYDSKHSIDGKQITTDQGENLGHISDLYLDESGHVIAFEVSGGLFADAMGGKRYLEMPAQMRVGEDVIIVPHESIHQLELQAQTDPGGLKAVYASASDKVTDVYGTVKDKATDAYGNIASASVDKQREFVIGKVAGRDVVIPANKATMATPAALTTGAVESGQTALPSANTTTSSSASPATLSDMGLLEVETKGDDTVVRPTDSGIIEAAGSAPTVGMPTSTTLGKLNARVVEGSPVSTASSTSSSSTPVAVPAAQTLTNLQRETPATATDISSAGEVVDGEILVRKGETITEAHADRAIQAGVLSQLVASAAMTGASGTLSTVQGKAGEYGEQAQGALENAALGKPAGREVDAADGSVLVAPGQIITQAILDRADAHGKKAEVIASAGMGAASTTAQDALGQAKETAVSVFDTIKEKVAELTGTAHEKKAQYDEASMEKKIKDAVGRPVTRVILAKDDTVILNTGDIITNKAVEHARSQDVLDILLDSVYDQTPDITPEMLRVQGSGEDALKTQAEPSGGPITATIAPSQS